MKLSISVKGESLNMIICFAFAWPNAHWASWDFEIMIERNSRECNSKCTDDDHLVANVRAVELVVQILALDLVYDDAFSCVLELVFPHNWKIDALNAVLSTPNQSLRFGFGSLVFFLFLLLFSHDRTKTISIYTRLNNLLKDGFYFEMMMIEIYKHCVGNTHKLTENKFTRFSYYEFVRIFIPLILMHSLSVNFQVRFIHYRWWRQRCNFSLQQFSLLF